MTDILNESDDEGFEVPGDDWSKFHSEEFDRDICLIQVEIRNELQISFEKDGNVQDASFFDELRILNPSSNRSNGVVALVPDIAIRFSNFGRLFTIYSLTDSLKRYPVDKLKELIGKHGWKFIDPADLDKPYDGKNDVLKGEKITWWVRYFDYL